MALSESQKKLYKLFSEGSSSQDILDNMGSLKDSSGNAMLNNNPDLQPDALFALESQYTADNGLEAPTAPIQGQNTGDVQSDPRMNLFMAQGQETVAQKVEPKEVSDGELWDAATDSEWVSSGLSRMYDRPEQDPNWSVDKETKQDLGLYYNEREQDYIGKADSEADLQQRYAEVSEFREREKLFQSQGWRGVGYQLGAAIVDPTMIATALVTGGLSTTARVGRVASILRSAGYAAAEGAAVETFLMQTDTNRDWSDVAFSALASGALGGLGGAFTYKPIAKEMELVKLKAEKEQLLQRAVESVQERRAYIEKQVVAKRDYEAKLTEADKAEAARVKRIEDRAVNQADDFTVRATQQVADDILPKKSRESITTRLKQIEEELVDLDGRVADDTDVYWTDIELAATGRGKSTAQANNQLRFATERSDRIGHDALDEIDNLREEQDHLRQLLDSHEEAVGVRDELEDVKGMSTEELIEHFSPDQAIEREAALQSRARIQDMRKQSEEDDWFDAHPKEKDAEGDEVSSMPDNDGNLSAAKTKRNPTYEDSRLKNEEEIDWYNNMIDEYENYNSKFGDNYVKYIPTWLLSDYSKLQKLAKEVPAIRGLAHLMFENPQGNSRGKTVSILSYTYDKQIRAAGRNAIDVGYGKWLKEQGTNAVSGTMDKAKRDKFEKLVMLEVRGVLSPEQSSDAIKHAAAGAADQFWAGGKMRKDNGVLGFENLERNDNYVPDVHSKAGYRQAFQDGWYEDDIKGVLARGYLAGDNDVTEAQAKLIANLKWANMSESIIKEGDHRVVFTARSREGTKKLLKEAKVPDDVIDTFLEEIGDKQDWASISDRARKSLHIDRTATLRRNGKTLTVNDLMENNISKLLESYTTESSASAAFGRVGIHSDGMFERLIEEAQLEGAALLANPNAGVSYSQKELSRSIRILRDGKKLIENKPVVDYHGEAGQANKYGRMLLDATAILRLQQVAFAQIPETARVMQAAGIADFIKGVPGSNTFRNPFKLESGRGKDFELQRVAMQDVERIMGFVGEQDMGQAFSVRSGEVGSEGAGRIEGAIDVGIEGARRVSQVASGFHMTQGMLEKAHAMSMFNRMQDFLIDGRKLTRRMKSQLDSVSSKEQQESWTKWLKDNHTMKADKYTGKEERSWNFENMPPDMKEDISVMFQRMQNQNVQKGLTGETSSEWFGPMSRFFTQFRSYSLVSLEKQLISGIRGDKAAETSLFLASTGMAYAAYMSQIWLRSASMEDGEEYFDEMTSPKALAWGVFNKHPQLASLGMVSDVALLSGVAPAELYDANRFGFQSGNLTSVIPAAGVVEDVLRTTKAGASLGWDFLRDDSDVGEGAVDFWNQARRVIPLTNTVYFGEYTKIED